MMIMGISGFEDGSPSRRGHVYARRGSTLDGILSFSGGNVPLQCFPLGLIGHDSSATLLVDGKVVASCAEERLTRVKHGFNLAGRTVMPRKAMEYCLQSAGASWKDVDYVAHYCRFTPEAVRQRLLGVARGLTAEEAEIVQREYDDAFNRRLARDVVRSGIEQIAGVNIPEERFIQVHHHDAHAAGAFFSSGFRESLILTMDGYGEEESSVLSLAGPDGIESMKSILLPTSLGLLYQVVTVYLGFRSFGDEYKVMGLSSYGDRSRYRKEFDSILVGGPGGSYSTDGLCTGDLIDLLRGLFGTIEEPGGYTQKSADIAASLQDALERTVLHALSAHRVTYPLDNLCLSGGVALNACMNSAILRSGFFRRVFIQPAASDDGAGMGAALYVDRVVLGRRSNGGVQHVYLGPSYSDDDILPVLEATPGIRFRREEDVEGITARYLAEGRMVGWFQGRMECGPRALGHRSILADPRSARIRDELNLRIKNREEFRPFAPAVLRECAQVYFDVPPGEEYPFMLITFPTRDGSRESIPAVVHVDGSSRIQTVTERDTPRFYRVIREFHRLSGVPVVLNTSFNRAGEPIVCSPLDAVRCFRESGLDVLVIGNFIVHSHAGT